MKSENTFQKGEISRALTAYTCEHSNFDKTRPYLSLSHANLPEDKIWEQFIKGFEDSTEIRLRCYKGYQMEKDMLERLATLYPIKTGTEISAFGGLVKGHPDFELPGIIGDIKSVASDRYLPSVFGIPYRAQCQMQAYLLFNDGKRGLFIFESRESGKIEEFWLDRSLGMMEEIFDKYERLADRAKKQGWVQDNPLTEHKLPTTKEDFGLLQDAFKELRQGEWKPE